MTYFQKPYGHTANVDLRTDIQCLYSTIGTKNYTNDVCIDLVDEPLYDNSMWMV